MSKRKTSGLSDGCQYTEKKCSKFDEMPRELVAEITFRLPPESLICLQSLNKSWYFLIRCLVHDPEFMAKHQRHAERYPTLLLVNDPPLSHCLKIQPEMKTELPSKLRRQRLRSSNITRLVDDGNLRCIAENIEVSHLPNIWTRDRRGRFDVYHCNGVVCFARTPGMRIFTLFSPVTGKFETFEPKPVRGRGNFNQCITGFGSDPLGNNFKVLRIMDSKRAQIFSPGTSRSWREIKIRPEDAIKSDSVHSHVYLKGYCFWIVTDLTYGVLCFDVCNEVFPKIFLPDELDTFDTFSNLTTLRDSLCLFLAPSHKPIDVWEMDVSTFSWGKLLRIEHPEWVRFPSTFWGSKELLLETTAEHELVSFNIRTQKLRRVSPKGMLGVVFYLGCYVKSLASAKWFR